MVNSATQGANRVNNQTQQQNKPGRSRHRLRRTDNLRMQVLKKNAKESGRKFNAKKNNRVRIQTHQTIMNIPQSKAPTQNKPLFVRENKSITYAPDMQGTNDKPKNVGFDMTTAQGTKAEKNSFLAAFLLIASMARDTSIQIASMANLDTLVSSSSQKIDEMSVSEFDDQFRPAKMLGTLMTSLEDAIDEYDPSDKGHARTMSYIASQLTKSWSPEKGGVGRFKLPKKSAAFKLSNHTSASSSNRYLEWNSDWDKLDKKFSSGNATEEDKKQLLEMCKFFRCESNQQFSLDLHPGALKVNQIQFAATIGQIMEDCLAYKSPATTILLEKLVENGLMSENHYKEVDAIRTRCRSNDLLSEVPNEEIIGSIVKQLEDKENAEAIKKIIRKEITQGNKNNEALIDEAIVDRIYDRYVKKVSEIQTKTSISGSRGRVKGEISDKMAKEFNGDHDGKVDFPFNSPDQKKDEEVLETIESILSKFPEFHGALDALNNGALASGYIPKTITHLNSGLSSKIKREVYDQPGKLIRSAVQDIADELKKEKADSNFIRNCRSSGRLHLIREKAKQIDILERFVDNDKNKLSGISNVIGKFQVRYNKAHDKTISMKEFAEDKCAVGLMAKHDLRTICGPSGTTVDTLLGLMVLVGVDNVKQIVDPIYQHVEYLKNPLEAQKSNIHNSKEFKTFFTALSLQMQGGRYHSEAEVLTGMYIVGMTLQNLDDDKFYNLKETLQAMDLLYEDFSKSPGKYYPIQTEDVTLAYTAYNTHINSQLYVDDISSSSSSSSDDDD